jgi:hypothetical protein
MAKTRKKSSERWSAKVMKHSNALDLESDRLQIERSSQYRALTEAPRQIQQTAQRHGVSIRDVDLNSLHQPRR